MRERRAALRRAAPVILLVVASTLALYWPLVAADQGIYWGTPMLQFWPWRTFAAQELRAGRLPLWNPLTGAGGPLVADHQTAVFYPLNLLFWIMPVARAMGLSLVLHALLAAATMYALARDLGLRRTGSAVAAIAFALSGYMVARGSFLTEVSALPWLPLIWLLARRLVRERRLNDVAWLALAFAVQFLAGHAQTWVYTALSTALVGGGYLARGCR